MCLFQENKLVQISLARLPSHLHVAPSSNDQKKFRENLEKASEKSKVDDGNFLLRCVFMPYVFRLSSSSAHESDIVPNHSRQTEREKAFPFNCCCWLQFWNAIQSSGHCCWKHFFVRTCARFFTEIRAILVITFSRKIILPTSHLKIKWPTPAINSGCYMVEGNLFRTYGLARPEAWVMGREEENFH